MSRRPGGTGSGGSGGGGGSPISYASVFTYRQGGVAANNVFTSFSAAYTAALAATVVGLDVAIAIDDSLGSPVTGAAGALNLAGIDLVAYRGGGAFITQPILTFQTGTTVTAWRKVICLDLRSTSAAAISTLGTGAAAQMDIWLERTIIRGGSAAVFFNIQNPAASYNILNIIATRWSFLFATTFAAATVASASYVIPYFFESSGCTAAAFVGAGGTYPDVFDPGASDGGGNVFPVALAPTYEAKPSQVNYIDAAPLLSATNVQTAITALKSNIPGTSAGAATYGARVATVTAQATFRPTTVVGATGTTTDAVQTVVSDLISTEFPVIAASTTWQIDAIVTAQSAADSAVWKIPMLISRVGASAATILGTVPLDAVTTQCSAGASAWKALLDIATANNPKIRATGSGGTTIKWGVVWQVVSLA